MPEREEEQNFAVFFLVFCCGESHFSCGVVLCFHFSCSLVLLEKFFSEVVVNELKSAPFDYCLIAVFVFVD
jgi:hypothetical protein